jgi:hypothetical protein
VADSTEIERLVVKLTGEGSEYKRMLDEAQRNTIAANRTVEALTKQIANLQAQMRAGAGAGAGGFGGGGLMRGLVGAAGAAGIAGIARTAFQSFGQMETASIRLKAAVESNGGPVDEIMKKYEAFSARLADTQNVSKMESMQLLKTAETMGQHGDAAMMATQRSLALSAATGVDANAAMRFVAALQSGNTELAMHMTRMIPALRGIKDHTQLQTKVNDLFNQGQRTQIELMNSAEGRMKKLEMAVAGVKKQFGETITEALMPVVDWLTKLVKNFGILEPQTKKIVGIILLVTAAFLALLPILSMLQIVMSPVFVLLGMIASGLIFVLTQVLINIPAWIIWNGILLLWSITVIAAKVAVWLFNAALSIMIGLATGGVMAAVALVAAFYLLIAAVALAAAGFIYIVAAVGAVWLAATSLIDVLNDLPEIFAPVKHITGLFKEWWDILQDVLKAAKNDMPSAWELLRAGFTLAINQIKDLWEPLWTFIKTGFQAAWEYVSTVAGIQFDKIAEQQKAKLANAAGAMSDEVLAQTMEATEKQAKASTELHGRLLKDKIKAAADAFKVTESAATKDARVDVDLARNKIKVTERMRAEEEEAAKKAAKENKLDIDIQAEAAKTAEHHIHQVTAALYNSADASKRYAEYLDRILGPSKQKGKSKKAQEAEDVAKQNEQDRLREVKVAGDFWARNRGVKFNAQGMVDIEKTKSGAIEKAANVPMQAYGLQAAKDAAAVANELNRAGIKPKATVSAEAGKLAEAKKMVAGFQDMAPAIGGIFGAFREGMGGGKELVPGVNMPGMAGFGGLNFPPVMMPKPGPAPNEKDLAKAIDKLEGGNGVVNEMQLQMLKALQQVVNNTDPKNNPGLNPAKLGD